MAEISLDSLQLQVDEGVETFQRNNQVIEVKHYLSAEEKDNLLQATIQAASAGTIFNPFALDVYFHLYLVIYYTNITFTEEEMSDLPKLYDILESSGMIDMILQHIDLEEYKTLRAYIDELSKIVIEYNTSIAKVINTIEQFAPKTAEKVSKELNEFDIDKYEQVVNIARAAGAKV